MLVVFNIFYSSCSHYLSSFSSAFRAEVNEPISSPDHIEVMLNHDDGIAFVNEFLKHIEEDADIIKMESSSGLIEDIDGLAGAWSGELRRELNSLRLTARKGGTALTKF